VEILLDLKLKKEQNFNISKTRILTYGRSALGIAVKILFERNEQKD